MRFRMKAVRHHAVRDERSGSLSLAAAASIEAVEGLLRNQQPSKKHHHKLHCISDSNGASNAPTD